MNPTTNTRILVPEFAFARPGSLDELFATLDRHGAAASVIAGGTDLVVQMKMERRHPAHVVSLAALDELYGISAGPEPEPELRIGATTTIREIARSAELGPGLAALREACDAFSTVSVMIMGTIGGNLCNASPAGDTAPALIVHEARLLLRSARGTREVALEAFFTGPGRTVLQLGEIVARVTVPPQPAGSGSAFRKLGRVVADISQVCAAVRLQRAGGRVTGCRLAMGAVAPTALRLPRVEAELTGKAGGPELFARAARLAAEDIRPISDVRASEGYRREAAQSILREALETAWRRAGEGV